MKNTIKEIALKMALDDGLINISRKKLCANAGIPEGSWAYIMQCSFSDFISSLDCTGPLSEVNKKRVIPSLRKQQILNVAVELSTEIGYKKITRTRIASKANVSPALITMHFNNMDILRIEIIKEAVKNDIIEIIAQCLIEKDSNVSNISESVKNKAVDFIMKDISY